MNLVLSAQDVEQLDKFVQEIPFKHAFPLFQFLRGKLQQQAEEEAKQKEAEKIAKVTKDNG